MGEGDSMSSEKLLDMPEKATHSIEKHRGRLAGCFLCSESWERQIRAFKGVATRFGRK